MSKEANNEAESKTLTSVEGEDVKLDAESDNDSKSSEDDESNDDEYQKELENLTGTKDDSEDVKKQRRKGYKLRQSYKERTEEDSDDEEVDMTEEVRRLVVEETEKIRHELRSSQISELIEKNTRSDNEAKLARYHLENSLKSTGDIAKDVQNAVALANRNRIKNELEEVKRSQTSKELSSNYSGGGRKPTKTQTVKLNEQEKRLVEAWNIPEEKVREAMSKKN